jgi:DNA polymerase-3 subunit epsilon/exodeoxyribonuclease X
MLIYLSLQTTGLEVHDKICSIGIISSDGDNIYNLVNEGKKISSKASSINHITNEMLKDKDTFLKSEASIFLEKYNDKSTTIIAHNAKFVLEKLLSSGFKFNGEVIDTMRVSKHLMQDCESFSLQYLRYDLKLYKQEKEQVFLNLCSKHALFDAYVVKLLYDYLLEIASFEDMIKLSFENVLMQKFGFGKYEGKYIEEISMNDRGYLEWMLVSISDLDEDLRYSINYYLENNL